VSQINVRKQKINEEIANEEWDEMKSKTLNGKNKEVTDK
jgi:hypothetical protein